jgi:hypothetical protein
MPLWLDNKNFFVHSWFFIWKCQIYIVITFFFRFNMFLIIL